MRAGARITDRSIFSGQHMDVEGFDSLIRLAQGGDPQALEKLLASIHPYLTRVASGYADPARASESVSDLIQEAEFRAWQRLRQFQGGSADEETHAMFRTWLVQIVRHIALDRSRARNTQKRKAGGGRIRSLDESGSGSVENSGHSPLDPPASGPSPSTALRETERSIQVKRALEMVPDDIDREIIRLYFFEQLSLPKIAERLGWSYDRVREHYRRGIQQLERRLQDLKP